MVKRSKLDMEVLWSHITFLRFKILEKSFSKKCYEDCIPEDDIIENFAQLIEDKSSEDLELNVSKSDISEASQMYFALISGPTIYEELYWKTIYGPTSRIPMLASNILKRAKGDLKVKALEVFAKITSMLGKPSIKKHLNI